MIRRRTAVVLVAGLFTAALFLSLVTHTTGVVRDDAARNIWIPRELTLPLQLKVAYDDEQVYFNYRWPAQRPHVYTDMLRYSDGQWSRKLHSPIGPEPDGIYEDRLAMMLDDGSVPEFQRYGGYITVGANMRDFVNDEPEGGDAHRRKYLPATRSDPNDWYSIVDAETLAKQREAGYFLDLWQWRAHLSNPVGWSDDQHVAWYRLYDAGDGPFFINWDRAARQPRFMFDAARAGVHALRWENIAGGQDAVPELYYLSEDMAVPFDAEREWQEGDVIPGQVLRQPSGSRASIRVQGKGRWADGHWEVTLVRALDTGDPMEDKVLRDQGVYDIALSVHRDAKASRWHYISMPVQVGLGRPADLNATRISGGEPDWGRIEPHEVTLFYPGQVNWPRLTSEIHAGSKYIAKGVPVKFRHKEAQLAQYGVEIEFESEIRRQWWLSMIMGVLLVISFVFSAAVLLGHREV